MPSLRESNPSKLYIIFYLLYITNIYLYIQNKKSFFEQVEESNPASQMPTLRESNP